MKISDTIDEVMRNLQFDFANSNVRTEDPKIEAAA